MERNMSAMNGGRPDVLVVNRDRLICLAMAKKLRRLGYSVVTTSSYYEARRVLSSNFPRLLIADVRLEQFNGLNLAWHRALTIPGPSIITDVEIGRASCRERV